MAGMRADRLKSIYQDVVAATPGLSPNYLHGSN